MYPNIVNALPMMTAHWQSQLTSWTEFYRTLNGSVLKAWETNLQFGEAILGGAKGASPLPLNPQQMLDSMGACRQSLASFATTMQAADSPFAAACTPGTVPPPEVDAPDTANDAKDGDDASRAADDEQWRAAEQAYLDTAGEDMHAEGHAQTSGPEAAAPAGPLAGRPG